MIDNKDKYYGTVLGLIIGDLVGNDNNINIVNRNNADYFKNTNKSLNFISDYILKIFKMGVLGANAAFDLNTIKNKLNNWNNKNIMKKKYRNISLPAPFLISLNNYNNGSNNNNYFTDYFGIIYPIFNYLLNNDNPYYLLTHNMPIIIMLNTIISNYLKLNQNSYLFSDDLVLNIDYVGNSDAFESLRCVFKALNDTNNFYDGLVLLLNKVENTHSVCILYGIIAGNHYGISNIFESNILINILKKLHNFNKIMDLIELGFKTTYSPK